MWQVVPKVINIELVWDADVENIPISYNMIKEMYDKLSYWKGAARCHPPA